MTVPPRKSETEEKNPRLQAILHGAFSVPEIKLGRIAVQMLL